MQTEFPISRLMIRQYADALDKWVDSLKCNVAGDAARARALATEAADRFDYIAQQLTVGNNGSADPHPDAVIAQYAIREYMEPDIDSEISTDQLEVLNRNRNLIGTLYEEGANLYSGRNGGQPVERPYATFGWKDTGSKWALTSPAEARAALALRYIETEDFAKASELLGRFDSNLCPGLDGAHMILLAQAGLWDTLINVAGVVGTRYSNERTRSVQPGDPDALGHAMRLNTWYLATYFQALAYASLGEFNTAEPIFTEVERATTMPVLVSLSAFNHARMAQAQGRDKEASELLSESLRIHPTQRARAAMSTGILPLRVTSADLISRRRDRWDPDTEPDPELERKKQLKSEQARMLERATLLLQEIIGMKALKAEMEELSFAIAEEGVKRSRGTGTKGANFNSLLLGHPGTGKTTITEYLALVFCAHGLVDEPEPVVLHRADLVAGFQGQSAGKTREALTKYTGRYILIDEAYALAQPPDINGQGVDPFGVEALDTIVAMSEGLYQKNTIMALAGYPDKMRALLEVNPGLGGRFPLRYEFASYSNEELYEIFAIRATERGLILDPDVKDLFTGTEFGILQREVTPGTLFADKLNNARLMRDLIETASRIGSARRGRSGREVHSFTDAEIAQVTAEDVRAAFWRLVEPKRYLLSG